MTGPFAALTEGVCADEMRDERLRRWRRFGCEWLGRKQGRLGLVERRVAEVRAGGGEEAAGHAVQQVEALIEAALEAARRRRS